MGQVGVVRCTILSDGTTLVVKYAEARGGALREEAAVYAALGSRRSPYFPVFYGLFTNGYWDAIILSDEGASLDSFANLSRKSR